MRWKVPRGRRLLVELFVCANLAFLVIDVAMAHAINRFENPVEWVPVAFAAVGAVTLVPGIVATWQRNRALGRAGMWVGWGGIIVGIAGLVYHLRSRFFEATTLHSLVYSAPFAAPLAFTGLGFLLLANRLVPKGTTEWAQWVLTFALGGFIGNFVLSLTDHAQNGFFNPVEWVPVVAAGFAVGFLVVALARPLTAGFVRVCWVVLGVQVVTGVAGFGLHLWFDAHGPAHHVLLDMLYGAPAFAPLLFADLAALAALGLAPLAEARVV